MDAFRDKVAIVTGGASGIGRAICQELAARGAVVIVADINYSGAEDTVAGIHRESTGAGKPATAANLDVTSPKAIKELVNRAVREHGRIDYMFNNAGIGVGGELRDLEPGHWRPIIDINLWGVVHGATAAYSVMVRQGFGHIVNTASLAGLIGAPTMTPYAATKFAVVGFSTSLRVEAADLGVKVSVICPGFVQSGIYHSANVVNARNEDIVARIPIKVMDTRKAARVILRGVARNRAIIIFPFYARLLWWLNRIHPILLAPLARRAARDFRKIRIEPDVEDTPHKTE